MTAVHVSAAVFPFLNLALFYVVWLLAWAILGHRPMPYTDDPKAVFGDAHMAAFMLPVLLFPVGMVLGLGSIVILCISHRAPGRALLWAAVLASLWVVFFNLVWWDPLRVIEWLGGD